MSVFKWTWKNMWYRKSLTVLTMLAIAIATAFIVFIVIMNDGVEKGAKDGFGPYELVIGAEGSRTQLVLNTFYHIGAPIGNVSYDIFEQVEAKGLYEAAYPMTRGDSYQGFPLIGVTSQYLSTRYPEVLLEGELYEETGEVVIGSQVSRVGNLQIGDTFHASHGYTEGIDDHHDLTFSVVGILPTLGTPDDKAMFTTLDYAWAIHQEEFLEQEKGDITSIVIVPKDIMELQAMQQTFDEVEGVQATFSQKTVSEMLSILDTGSELLIILSIVCMVVAAISVILALTAVSVERKKSIGLLRLLGKSQSFIVRGLILEGMLISGIGSMVGLVLGHVVTYMLSGYVFTLAGISIYPWHLHVSELYIVGGSILIGSIASFIPALQSYKVNPILLFQSA